MQSNGCNLKMVQGCSKYVLDSNFNYFKGNKSFTVREFLQTLDLLQYQD